MVFKLCEIGTFRRVNSVVLSSAPNLVHISVIVTNFDALMLHTFN